MPPLTKPSISCNSPTVQEPTQGAQAGYTTGSSSLPQILGEGVGASPLHMVLRECFSEVTVQPSFDDSKSGQIVEQKAGRGGGRGGGGGGG